MLGAYGRHFEDLGAHVAYLGLFMYHFGPTGTILDAFWNHFGAILEPFGEDFGSILKHLGGILGAF